MKICKKVQFEEKLFLELWSSPVGPSPDENDLLLWNYFFSGQTLDSDAPKKYMRENGNILVWCDLMPRVNLMYCITIKNGVVIYSWGSSIFLWLLWGNKSIFKPKKKWQKENEKLPIFCRMQSYFPPSFCSCCLCGCFTFNCCSTQLLISPRKALFRRKKKLV